MKYQPINLSNTLNCDGRGQHSISLWVGLSQQNYNECSWQQYCQLCWGNHDTGGQAWHPECKCPKSSNDGFFAKTNKVTILHNLKEDFHQEDLPYPKDVLFIQDGLALLHVLTNLPPTYDEICLQILDQMIAKNISCSRRTAIFQDQSMLRKDLDVVAQRGSFLLDQQQESHSTSRCSLQMTTTRSSSVNSWCRYI